MVHLGSRSLSNSPKPSIRLPVQTGLFCQQPLLVGATFPANERHLSLRMFWLKIEYAQLGNFLSASLHLWVDWASETALLFFDILDGGFEDARNSLQVLFPLKKDDLTIIFASVGLERPLKALVRAWYTIHPFRLRDRAQRSSLILAGFQEVPGACHLGK